MSAWDASKIHVLPIGDLREHDERDVCWCRPKFDGRLVVHNSMDGRETYERGRKLQ